MVVNNISFISGKDAYEALVKEEKKNIAYQYSYGIVSLIIGVIILLYAIFVKDYTFLTMGILFMAFSIAFSCYNTFHLVKAPTTVLNKNKELCDNGVTYEYKFHEKSVDVVVLVKDKRRKVNYPYDTMKKIFEFEDRYQMFITSTDVMFVLKEGFEDKKMEEFFRKNVSSNKKLKIIKREKK